MESAIEEYPVRKAKTVRFTCGAPRSPKLIGDGSRMLFLRSAGEQDTENSLWLAICGEDAYAEVELVNAGELVNTLGSDDVPAAERARRERARESATGIVAYSVDGLGNHVASTVNGELFVTTIDWDALAYTVGDDGVRAQVGAGVRTEHLVPQFADSAQNEFAGPVLNPRMSPDGKRVAYATGSAVVVVDVQTAVANAVFTVSPQDRETMRAGLAEFAAGEEMDRYDGFWWGPDSRTLLVECFDSSPEPVWTISDPADPAARGIQHRYPRALTENAVVDLFAVRLGDDGTSVQKTAMIDWDNVAYEYLAVVDWQAERPVLRVLDRLQQHEQILRVAMPAENEWGDLRALDGNVMALLPVEVIAEHHNDQWIDLVGGTPCVTPSGAVVCSVNDMEADTNRLSVDGRVFTPAGWQVREVLDAGTDDVLCVVQRTAERAAEVPEQWADSTAERYHDARSFDIVTISYADGSVRAVSDEPGVWRASRRGDGLVVWGRTMDSAKAVMRLSYGAESYADGSVRAVSDEPGVWRASRRGDGLVVWGRTMDSAKAVMRLSYGAECARTGHDVCNVAAEPDFVPNVRFVRLGERKLFTAIVAPSASSRFAGAAELPVLMHPYGGPGHQEVVMSRAAYLDAQWWADQGYLVVIADGRGTTGRGPVWDRDAGAAELPVLMHPYGGPGHQEVVMSRAAYLDAQWWADQGYLVVIADGRGTTGRGPVWDREVYLQMKRVSLADQVDAVHALAGAVDELNRMGGAAEGCEFGGHDDAARPLPKPDLERVAMIGWSYGGFLSALAVLDAPDTFAAACAGAPPTDWTLYDTCYTERFLGLDPQVYADNSIVLDAPKLVRPLMLIHGFADDNVTIAHSLRLSQALMEAGRPHTFLPLTGITHMTNDPDVARNLLILQRDFLADALAR